MKKGKNIVIFIGIFLLYVIVSFLFIGFKAKEVIMPVSEIPLWVGNLIFCFIFGLYIYFELCDYICHKNKEKKILTKYKK